MNKALYSVLSSGVALAAMLVCANAADLPGRAPTVAPAPIFVGINWTGFYVGAQVGGAWTSDKITETPPFNSGNGNLDASSVIGGLHAGYNWQASQFVFGLEGDVEASGLNRTSTCWIENAVPNNAAPGTCFPAAQFGAYYYSTNIGVQSSFRGRLGYAFDRTLLYVTGGIAFADVKNTYATTSVVTGTQSFSRTATGWTLGAGVEYAFNSTWSARLEYRYTDFGTSSEVLIAQSGNFWNGFTTKPRLTENAVRVGISYHFASAPAAVVAKY